MDACSGQVTPQTPSDNVAADATAATAKKAKGFPWHKLFFFGGLGLLVLFILRDKSKKALQ